MPLLAKFQSRLTTNLSPFFSIDPGRHVPPNA
jgi:hypothetical protein